MRAEKPGRRVAVAACSVVLIAVSSLALTQGALSTIYSKFTEASKPVDPKSIAQNLLKMPLRFEENQGQTDASVDYLAKSAAGTTIFLTPEKAVFGFQKDAVTMQIEGAGPSSPRAFEELAGKSNYLLGNDLSKWKTDVSAYKKVRYEQIYPGIDLVYYGKGDQLEYDFLIAPGADPSLIALHFEGQKGIRIGQNGDLVMSLSGGEIRHRKPSVYQLEDGNRKRIPGRYSMQSRDTVRFEIGNYDATRPLIIDPVVYSSYVGGSGLDASLGVAVDASGNAFLTGEAGSTNFPTTTGALSTARKGPTDAFVAKVNPSGGALVYSTFLGGDGDDTGYAIALDSTGSAYLTGDTTSPNFPTTAGVLSTARKGPSDGFVSKLNATGTALTFSTYLGGDGDETGASIAIDATLNAFVTGVTSSANFPTTVDAPSTARKGATDAFVTKLNPLGVAAVYSTYLGGDGDEDGFSVALDSSSSAYITGATASANFPTTTGALSTTLKGPSDGFVTKLNATGTAATYSTFLGGDGEDGGSSIALDSSLNAYIAGITESSNFPTTAGALSTSLKGSTDGFVTKLNPAGAAAVYATYLGGDKVDGATGIGLDSSFNAYVTGLTDSQNFPTTTGALKSTGPVAPDIDAFVTKLNPAGAALVYSTYLGGADLDAATAISVDTSSNAYVAGFTVSTNFPVASFQAQTGGLFDGFITKLPANGGGTSTTNPTTDPVTQGTPGTPGATGSPAAAPAAAVTPAPKGSLKATG